MEINNMDRSIIKYFEMLEGSVGPVSYFKRNKYNMSNSNSSSVKPKTSFNNKYFKRKSSTSTYKGSVRPAKSFKK
jgi:hypothetical protein